MSDANLGDGANGQLSDDEISDIVFEAGPDAALEALVDLVERIVREHTERALAEVERELADVRAAHQIASDVADRFRDVVSECLGLDENPGDDELVRLIRAHFGNSGPEPRRWRDFMTGAEAIRDQIRAARQEQDR